MDSPHSYQLFPVDGQANPVSILYGLRPDQLTDTYVPVSVSADGVISVSANGLTLVGGNLEISNTVNVRDASNPPVQISGGSLQGISNAVTVRQETTPWSVSLTGASVSTVETVYNQKIVVYGNTTYVAKANPGTTQTALAWQVSKITATTDGETTTTLITWANGSGAFSNPVLSIESLPYS